MPEIKSTEIGLLSPEQVGKVLNVTPATVRNLIREGELPAHKIGKQWRINYKALADYVWGTASFSADDENMEWLEADVRAVLAENRTMSKSM